jgi:hypothetical protein
VRLRTERRDLWLTVRDKFAPFGYVPSELREQPAILLTDGAGQETVRAPGAKDQVIYGGRADVREDGSAKLQLVLSFDGARAIAWRTALDRIPKAKLYDFVEREIVAPAFSGGHVREIQTDSADTPDKPLIMHVSAEVPELAKPGQGGLVLHPPFSPSLAPLAALPSRRTPLLRRASWHAEVRIQIVLPDSTKMPVRLPAGEEQSGAAVVRVHDTVSGHAIDFNRTLELPSGRVEPGPTYVAWQRFVHAADALFSRDVLLGK